MKVRSRRLPDPLERIKSLPQWLESIPPTAFSPHYSPAEKLLLAIWQGLTPSQKRKELGKHVERLVDMLQREGLIAFKNQRQIGGYWRNSYELTPEGLDHMGKSWTRENVL